jgi:hypothetical protein
MIILVGVFSGFQRALNELRHLVDHQEMRIAGIDSMEQANAWLPTFIEDFNHRFARAPHSLKDAHRPLRESHDELDDIFARQKTRKVSNALTLQYDKVVYLIEPTDATQRLAG